MGTRCQLPQCHGKKCRPQRGSAGSRGREKSPFSQHEGVRIIPTRHTRRPFPQALHGGWDTPVEWPWGSDGGTVGVQHAEGVTPRQGCVTSSPSRARVQGRLGIFANQRSTLLHGKATPGTSRPPLPRLLERQKQCRGCVSKIPPLYPAPHQPQLTAVGPAPVTALVTPSWAALGATMDAATLNRLLCPRAS